MLSNFEKAIKLAIEKGGYRNLPKKFDEANDIYEYDRNAIVLDPLFWQSLGRALGWTEKHSDKNHLGCPDLECWCNVAGIYFRVKLTNGDEEAFWNQQLKNL